MRAACLILTSVVVGSPLTLAPAAVAVPIPHVTCVTADPAGGFVGYWGYSLPAPATALTLPVGTTNAFQVGAAYKPTEANQGQPTQFVPDAAPVAGFADTRTEIAVRVPFTSGMRWKLDAEPAAIVSTTSPRCDFNLATTLVPDRSVARPGETITWTLTVTNRGGTPFPWREAPPTSTTLAFRGPLDTLPDELFTGESARYTATSRVPAESCFADHSAEATATFGAGLVRTADSAPADNTARGAVSVACSVDLQVTSRFDAASYVPGQGFTRTVTVTNTGEAPIPTAVLQLTDTHAATLAPTTPATSIPPGGSLTYTGSGAVAAGRGACGTLAGTTVATLVDPSGRYADRQPTDNTWTTIATVAGGACATPATVTPPPPTGTTAGSTTAPPPGSTSSAPPARAAVALRATAPPRSRPGRQGVITARIANTGTTPMRNVAIAISIPRRMIIAQRLGRSTVRTGNTVWLRQPLLAPGATFAVSLRVRFPVGYSGTRRTLVRGFADGLMSARTVAITRLS